MQLNTMVLLGTLLLATAAQAEPKKLPELFALTQRNCFAEDIYFDSKAGPIDAKRTSTNCIWFKYRMVRDKEGNPILDKDGNKVEEDATMQLSVHVSQDVKSVSGRCVFHPARSDMIYSVLGAKSAGITRDDLKKAGVDNGYVDPQKKLSSKNSKNINGILPDLDDKTNAQEFTFTAPNYNSFIQVEGEHAGLSDLNIIFTLDRWFGNFDENDKVNCVIVPGDKAPDLTSGL